MRNLWGKTIAIIMTFIMLFLCITNINAIAEEYSYNGLDVFAKLAFPTAEGNGKYANGFRGGKVVRVTNLNDSGEGSLRWALEDVCGPRIVVFSVGGVIELESEIRIDEEHGNVYIAGQTAPGDGITIIKAGIYISKATDVVIRNVRIRHGTAPSPTGCIVLSGVNSCIIDHCSLSWANGPICDTRRAQNVTIQNSILAEPLIDSYGASDDGPNGYYSVGTGVLADDGSYHHNIISNCMNRSIGIWNNVINQDSAVLEISNNLIFNWYYNCFEYQNLSLQLVNNTFKTVNNATNTNVFSVDKVSDRWRVHLNGNVLNDVTNDWDLVKVEGVSEEQLSEIKHEEPLFTSDINIESAESSYEKILSNSGAIVPKLDDIDKRYIREIENGEAEYSGSETGMKGFLNSVEDAEGYPNETTFKGGEAYLDSDEDGMPDEWEIFHGLNPDNYYDACQVYLSDEGYTNIELYINELIGDPCNYSEDPVIRYNPEKITETERPTEVNTAIPTENPSESPTAVRVLIGDVNTDGNIDAEDALSVLKHAAKLEILIGQSLEVADTSEDGHVDAEDALRILKKAARLIETL